jgi:hypothetical protein
LKVYKVESSWGVAPNPTFFFALMPKRMQKRSRLRSLRTKNWRLSAKIFITHRLTAAQTAKIF